MGFFGGSFFGSLFFGITSLGTHVFFQDTFFNSQAIHSQGTLKLVDPIDTDWALLHARIRLLHLANPLTRVEWQLSGVNHRFTITWVSGPPTSEQVFFLGDPSDPVHISHTGFPLGEGVIVKVDNVRKSMFVLYERVRISFVDIVLI